MKLKPYKGFEGAVTYVDPEANTLTAEVVNCEAGIHAQASTPAELQREWEASVDAYLVVCEQKGIEPMKPFSGVMSLRLGADLHRDAHRAARLEGKSVNAWIKDTVSSAVAHVATLPAYAGTDYSDALPKSTAGLKQLKESQAKRKRPGDGTISEAVHELLESAADVARVPKQKAAG